MKNLALWLALLAGISACEVTTAQRANLYRCEGCEAVHEYSGELSWKTSIAEGESGEPLLLTGTVYRVDGKTPAPGVIVYAYHTNAGGVYPTRGDEEGWGRRHGYLRGWVKSDENGRYAFETIKPGSYPNRRAAAHIHMTVKEPDHREYWIEEVVFAGDPYLENTRPENPQGGPGLVELERLSDGTWKAVRDIILERHPE